MMRRTVLLLVTTALALIAAGGIALAATFTCTTNPCDGTTDDDVITGTLNAETINGKAGNDEISARDANDTLNGEDGNDTMHGELGDDRLNGGDGPDQLLGEDGVDRMDGQAGNDDLDGGLGNDVFFVTANWGSDTIIDGGGNDAVAVPSSAAAAMPNLRVNLVSGTGAEVTDGTGNTVNWNDNVIEDVTTGAGDDVISQIPKEYNGMNGGAGNDTYEGYTTDPTGGDTIYDPSGTADMLDLSNYNVPHNDPWNDSWRVWKNTSTGNVETLQLWPGGAPNSCFEEVDCRHMYLSRYFDNTSPNVCASGPGPGLIETIKFKDDPNVDFAQVKSLLGCPPSDTTPPMVNSTSPANNATGIASTANVSATFSEAMDQITLSTSTFTLTKQGSSTSVAAHVTYDAANNKATLDPDSTLEADTTYTATVKGGSSGAKDLAGNALAQDYSWSFTTASPPPPSCTISGTANAETISGTSGDDVICAGGGNDTLKGLGGNDTIKGEDGNDTLLGGLGNNTLDGGLGTDTASYSASLTAVVASLATNSSTGEGTDTFLGVENLLGSSKADTLTGSGTNNKLTGGGGSDIEHGGGGSDTVIGSGGADILNGEDGDDTVNSKDGVSGNDSLDGGAGTDTKVSDATEKSIVGFP